MRKRTRLGNGKGSRWNICSSTLATTTVYSSNISATIATNIISLSLSLSLSLFNPFSASSPMMMMLLLLMMMMMALVMYVRTPLYSSLSGLLIDQQIDATESTITRLPLQSFYVSQNNINSQRKLLSKNFLVILRVSIIMLILCANAVRFCFIDRIQTEMECSFETVVFRKLAELGYHRSAKKCKEKFENVYKYHKRTREGRASKPDGKTYRFFDQLEALESQPSVLPLLPPPRPQAHQATTATPVAVAMPQGTNPPIVSQFTVPSTANPISINPTNLFPSNPPPVPVSAGIANPINLSQNTAIPSSHHPNTSRNFASISTSSSTSSDEEPERRLKRKRKWDHFFQRLMKEVIEKQEEMQKKFLETLERRERDRVAREEAWRVQEMARMNREHELLVQERSMAAAKDAAVIAFLQKVSGQQIPNVAQMQIQMQMQVQPQDNPMTQAPQPPPPTVQSPPPPQSQPLPPPPAKNLESPKTDNGGENFVPTSSSRWPKAEVQALIRLRTNLDLKYQETGPKGPLWEEISAAMRKIGYNRSSKRCKEKWENINKYFKKVKESNKKRPEDSKTCPYFHDLDALYKEKAKNDNSFNPGLAMKPENPMVPIMVQPEQQWPLTQEQHQPESAMEDRDSGNMDQNNEDEDEDEDEDEEDEDDEAAGYEIVTNKPSSVGTIE